MKNRPPSLSGGINNYISLKTKIARAAGIAIPMPNVTRHPPPVTILPIFRCRPLLVSGMPMAREILDLAAEIPTNLFHEKPPRFMSIFLPVAEHHARQRPEHEHRETSVRCSVKLDSRRRAHAPVYTSSIIVSVAQQHEEPTDGREIAASL